MSSTDEDIDAKISDLEEFSDAGSLFLDESSDAGSTSSEEISDAEASLRSRSELLSLARRLYPRKGEKFINKRSRDLARVPNGEYALYAISCKECHLHQYDELFGRQIQVARLSGNCRFCSILRKCHHDFGKQHESMSLYFHGSRTDLQICLGGGLYGAGCSNVHVQLYSLGPRMHQTPFRYATDVCEDPGSGASISLMKKWLSRCHMIHAHASPESYCKPTRLIKLGNNEHDAAQLCSTKSPVRFAALSYRWGAGKQSETTTQNVDERSKKLVTSNFPKTLRDAIHVTRGLGLEYIWIDRICIVQNDADEWAKEALLMADIYANAYVVLSATATEDCDKGFLQKRREPLLINYTQNGQENLKVRARQVESHYCDRRLQRNTYVLFHRGWCMQERFLARRIIHFLPDEVLFECERGRECECGAAVEETQTMPTYQGYKFFTQLRAARSMPGSFAFQWLEIVRDYSKMSLTYGEDSLPALSGLAAHMEHLKPGKYIAGLWQHDIVLQLGWRVDPKSITRRWKHPQNVEIIGPTFSWSSHVRNTEFDHSPDSAHIICALESFQVQLATPNPYGRVLRASVCLSGRVALGETLFSWLQNAARGGRRPSRVVSQWRTAYGRAEGRVYLDAGFDMDDRTPKADPDDMNYEKWYNETTWRSVICFGLFEQELTVDEDVVDALLLQRDRYRAGEYVRIGVVQQLSKTWFDENTVASTIMIV